MSVSKPLSALIFAAALASLLADEERQTQLLIVGGTESGCAAAVQAVRMGVTSITIANDIDWLGGQFSAEALGAIDENRGPAGYDQTVPFPRNGLFREVIDRIEALNLRQYGKARPGNTKVITTARPSDSEHVFRDLLEPYVKSGRITILSHCIPTEALMVGNRLSGLRFRDTAAGSDFTIRAALTIDASDWGDAIKLSGAAYEFGPDLKEKYGEPRAPVSREDYPITDMNPITYCLVVEEADNAEPIPAPPGYDPRNYRDLPYPMDPLWIYENRRLIDHYGFKEVHGPDFILLCHPSHDYPLDVLPKAVVDALEANEPGASKRNIVEMTRDQREIIFADAKRRSLGFLYYLQTEAHDRMPDKTHSFRRFKLSEEFGTADHLPPKPYIRESLRLKAAYMVRQQDTTGWHGNALNFAGVMFHDVIACWQFEYDFHPTKREFVDPNRPDGPWHGVFREGRKWGPPYSGKATFPLRSLIPEKVDGLLGAQKNLGFSSLVSSAVRLHDNSMAVGQGAGAAAAVALQQNVAPREIPFRADLMDRVWKGLCARLDGGMPATLFPFADLDPSDPSFVAVNQLAERGLLPIRPDQVNFAPGDPADADWLQFFKSIPGAALPSAPATRGEAAISLWKAVESTPPAAWPRLSETDADGDHIPDSNDPLPFSAAADTWASFQLAPEKDGVPPEPGEHTRQFYFAGKDAPAVPGFTRDLGAPYDVKEGFGWDADLTKNNRLRSVAPGAVRDSFIFTRQINFWECAVKNGVYRVRVCLGDAAHPQPGQNLTIEGIPIARNVSTQAGEFLEATAEVEVTDGRLTITIGKRETDSNTCLNWLQFEPIR